MKEISALKPQTQFIGQKIFYFPSLSTTMEVAKEYVRKGYPEGTVIIAGEQTAGRGRKGRTWLSPKGGLYLSLILYPSIDLLPHLMMFSSLAVVKAIEDVCGLKPQIKWPNDILIKGKKVGGILIESAIQGERVDYAIIGIGLNINLDPSFFPQISPFATSLSKELGQEISYLSVVKSLLEELERLYLRLKRGEDIYAEWRGRLEILGKRVKVIGEGLEEEGVVEEIEKDGTLLLRRDDGSILQIPVGDISLTSLYFTPGNKSV